MNVVVNMSSETAVMSHVKAETLNGPINKKHFFFFFKLGVAEAFSMTQSLLLNDLAGTDTHGHNSPSAIIMEVKGHTNSS